MLNSILTSRSYVPIMIIVYGLFLFGLRYFTLGCNDVNMNILLVTFTSVGAIFTWAIDIC